MKKLLVVAALAAACSGSLFAADGAELYKKCVQCHGKNAEMQYFKKVPALNTVAKEERLETMKALKAGELNGGKGKFGLGAVMKVQMSKLSEEDLAAVNDYIETLK
ncbi:c-type cytochrome [Campylobacter hominis]|uniref:Cytochrome c553 n=1 Tax=Campylobacter hominis (strain ATCC BAA-381 / DSM 21671 / CCUG 45161 / LMG 19568 / NCTC 13146 / CH001A) TaxID=360107 RepID=A7I2P6_CAMHC|nr:c-type cytochrome [Campylobacter hominis]ABS51244.1 cytochrome c553 [Campylobacter hominis ATCC BAA-381]UAK85964.1 c-type cytochrome [Campylobacter hominis]SUW85308.1 cytochrome c553 [Campylobacter hominis]